MKLVRSQQRFNFSFFLLWKLHLFFWQPSSSPPSLTAGYEPKDEKRILILFGAQSDLSAFGLVEKGIKSSLEAGSEFRIEYFIEYMDRFRDADPTHYRLLSDLYRHKFSGKKIDLVISWGAPASEWVSVHRDEIFPQTPVFFAGILQKQLKTLD